MQVDNLFESDASSSNDHHREHHVDNNEGVLAGSATSLNEENGTKSCSYKTTLCKHFSEYGECRYGGECALLTTTRSWSLGVLP